MPTASGILCATHTLQKEPATVNIVNFIIELFCKVDDAIPDASRHPQVILSVSEVVTIGIPYAVKGLTAKDPAARFLPLAPRQLRTLVPPNCRNAPAYSAAGTPNATGPAASWPPLL